jgi:transposase
LCREAKSWPKLIGEEEEEGEEEGRKKIRTVIEGGEGEEEEEESRTVFTTHTGMGKPVSDRVKNRLRIQTLLELRYSVSRIMKTVGCDKKTVTLWKRRFEEGSSEQDRQHPGRPKKIDPELCKQLVKRVSGHRGRSTRKSAAWLRTKGVPVSHVTVSNTLAAEGLFPYHRRKQPKVTEAHRNARIAFANRFMGHNWTRTLMTDETQVSLIETPNSKNDIVWLPRGADIPTVDQDAYARTLRFWAGASAQGRTRLFFFDGNLDGEQYRDILRRALPEMKSIFRRRRWTFQHDGAPAHTARETDDWLQEHVPNYIPSGPGGQWPAKSPDLNWIENLWGIMKAKVGEGNPVTSLEALKRRLISIWSNIPDETLTTCAQSMPQRLADVIRTRGQPLNY